MDFSWRVSRSSHSGVFPEFGLGFTTARFVPAQDSLGLLSSFKVMEATA